MWIFGEKIFKNYKDPYIWLYTSNKTVLFPYYNTSWQLSRQIYSENTHFSSIFMPKLEGFLSKCWVFQGSKKQ